MVQWFALLREDLKRRMRPAAYWRDWVDGMDSRVIKSAVFMLFASIAPAITFNASAYTGGHIGTPEMILSTAVGGAITAVLNGQPLLIVGITKLCMIFYKAMYAISLQFEFPFLPFMFWVNA